MQQSTIDKLLQNTANHHGSHPAIITGDTILGQPPIGVQPGGNALWHNFYRSARAPHRLSRRHDRGCSSNSPPKMAP